MDKLRIPQHTEKHLFLSEVPVTKCRLPYAVPRIHHHKPSKMVDAAFGQTWFDGAKSIQDLQFNEGQEHFPVWAIRLREQLAVMQEYKRQWQRSSDWVELQLSRNKNKDN